MKYIIYVFILFTFVYFFTLPKKPLEKEIKPVVATKESEEKVVKLLDKEKILNISLEDYVIGVVACEMPASFNEEALKAQAVASRTYSLEKMKDSNEYDLENSTNNQCYSSILDMQEKWKASYNLYYNKIKEAVLETKGEYLTYEGKIIKAFYFSTSNGYTEDVQNVFGETLEYLESTESSWDLKSSTYEKEFKISTKEFLKKLNLNDKKIEKIHIDERSESGRVNYITINNTKFKGTTFRSLLKIRSTDFDIKEEKEEVIITTRGYGHGVGLSQYGANGMANEGYNYKEILNHYYKNTEINNV